MLKCELGWRAIFQVRAASIGAVAHDIDGFYNSRQRHSAHSFVRPAQL